MLVDYFADDKTRDCDFWIHEDRRQEGSVSRVANLQQKNRRLKNRVYDSAGCSS